MKWDKVRKILIAIGAANNGVDSTQSIEIEDENDDAFDGVGDNESDAV